MADFSPHTTITIQTDGTVTVAVQQLRGKVVAKSTVRRPGDDKPSTYHAAHQAIEQLHHQATHPRQKEPFENYSDRVVCVRARLDVRNLFTVGKIYSIDRGFMKRDDGTFFNPPLESIKDLMERTKDMADFINIVE